MKAVGQAVGVRLFTVGELYDPNNGHSHKGAHKNNEKNHSPPRKEPRATEMAMAFFVEPVT
jgi:hypothetical protein